MMLKCFDISCCSNPINCGMLGYTKLIDFRTNEWLVFHNTRYLEYGGYVVAGGDRFDLTPLGVSYVYHVIDRANAYGVNLFNIELEPQHIILT